MNVRYRDGWVIEATLFTHPVRLRLEDWNHTPGMEGWPDYVWVNPEIVEERILLESHLRAQQLTMDAVRRAIDSQALSNPCDHPGCGEQLLHGVEIHGHLWLTGRPGHYTMCAHPGREECHR